MRKQQIKDGIYQKQTGVSNTLSPFKTIEEEKEGREDAMAAQIQCYRKMLPIWLRQLAKLEVLMVS